MLFSMILFFFSHFFFFFSSSVLFYFVFSSYSTAMHINYNKFESLMKWVMGSKATNKSKSWAPSGRIWYASLYIYIHTHTMPMIWLPKWKWNQRKSTRKIKITQAFKWEMRPNANDEEQKAKRKLNFINVQQFNLLTYAMKNSNLLSNEKKKNKKPHVLNRIQVV